LRLFEQRSEATKPFQHLKIPSTFDKPWGKLGHVPLFMRMYGVAVQIAVGLYAVAVSVYLSVRHTRAMWLNG